MWPKNPLDWFRIQFGYYLWGRWGLIERFISQDRSMVRYSSDFAKRHGGFRGSPRIYRPDAFHQLWQQYYPRPYRCRQTPNVPVVVRG